MIQTNNTVIKDKGRLKKLIRKAIVRQLKGKTDVGDRVFPNATVPPWEEELPVILVYPRGEVAVEYAVAPRELERDLDINIEVIGKGPEENIDLKTPAKGKRGTTQKTLEDILDDIAEQVECELSRDETLGGNASKTIYQNCEYEFDSAGGVPVGAIRLTFGVTYYTMSPRDTEKQGKPSQLKKINVKFNTGDDENTRESEDDLDIPTV